MAKYLTDLDEVPAETQHLAGKGVAKAVAADTRQAGASTGAVDDFGHCGRADGTMWGNDTQNHIGVIGPRAGLGQVRHESLTDLDGKRESIEAPPFAPHEHLSGAPVDVNQPQGRYLARAKAQASHEVEDYQVTEPTGTQPVAASQQCSDLGVTEHRWQASVSPVGDITPQPS